MDEEEDDPEADDGAVGPDESDLGDEPALILCPRCARRISEESEQCPYCGFFVRTGSPPRPWWWLIAVILLVLLLLRYVLRW